MTDDGKTAMLNAAIEIGKFYAFLAQALRTVFDPKLAAQLPEALLDSQLDQIRAALAPILEKNQVVKKNLEKIDREVARIREAAQDDATRERAVRDAQQVAIEVADRAVTVSDLVGLFRRL
ncbi:MAG TPA: hypothetical protein VI382_01805 [Candidatus Manganitrophaceae bacterium]|nr:hypothetical protein [Candidatus Manganitrophaceae bacterium]